MTTNYLVRIRNRAGTRQYDVDNFLSLDYSKYLNGYGAANIELPGNHPAIDTLQKDGQIEIWRFDEQFGIDPYCDWFGLYRDRDRFAVSNSKNGVFRMKCLEKNHYLWRAVTGHPAGTSNRNDFSAVAAETVMKNIFKYNCTSSATLVDGRKRVPTWVSIMAVEADSARGNNVTRAFAHRKVLDCLQELATAGGIDFDLVKTGARTYEFRVYDPLGSDLTSNIKFSATWDNLGNPQLTGDALDEETVAMVWGQDTGASRDFSEVHGANYVADYNDIETYVDAANQSSGSLDDAGAARMREVQAKDDFRFNILQGNYRYGRDYCASGVLGDLISVTYYEGTGTRRIRGAHVSVSRGSGNENPEQIQLDTIAQ